MERQVVATNYKFVSGQYGEDVMRGYTTLLNDYQSWTVPLPMEEKVKLAPLLACSLTDAWRRLVEIWNDPRFRIFDAVQRNEVPIFVYLWFRTRFVVYGLNSWSAMDALTKLGRSRC